MYSDTISNGKVNKLYTDWFSINSGVRQGDTLSPTLFSLFINDLAKEIKASGYGITVGNDKVPILLYADDIALLDKDLRWYAEYVRYCIWMVQEMAPANEL